MHKKVDLTYIIVLLLFFFIPPSLITYSLLLNNNLNYLLITSVVYVFLFVVVYFINLFSKKEYLKIIFGCHSKECRSISFIHSHLKICARCFGILIGILIMPLVSLININRLYFLLLSVPLIIDGLIQKYSNYESNNFKRVTTGILFGFSLITIFTYFYLYQSKLLILIIKKIRGG